MARFSEATQFGETAQFSEAVQLSEMAGQSEPRVHRKPTLDLENELAGQGFDLIVGFDEVGRGALAGPVMVGAAAIWARRLPDYGVPERLADSKLLTEHRREALFEPLQTWCAAHAVGQASNAEIDEWGISHALGVAALRALNGVERTLGLDAETHAGNTVDAAVSSSTVSSSTASSNAASSPITAPASIAAPSALRVGAILDGPNDYITKALNTFDAPDVPIAAHVVTLVKADQRCASVAAASVIAKVTRDRLMVSIARGNDLYRPYQWDHNKGYGSAAHREAIARYGATDLHRRSWHLV
jgi:ribonuclease HII